MRNFMLGVLVGSVLTAGLGLAGSTFYDSSGTPAAPRGSIQQFDYFRQRQLFLDAAALRRQADTDRLRNLTNPCAR